MSSKGTRPEKVKGSIGYLYLLINSFCFIRKLNSLDSPDRFGSMYYRKWLGWLTKISHRSDL